MYEVFDFTPKAIVVAYIVFIAAAVVTHQVVRLVFTAFGGDQDG